MPDESNIEKLQKSLYEREESLDLQKRQKDVAAFGRREVKVADQELVTSPVAEFVDVMKQRTKKRHRLTIGVVAVTAAVAIVAGAVAATFWYRASLQVLPAQIVVGIKAPDTFTSGEDINYALTYHNASRMAWQKVELSFEPPLGFTYHNSIPSAERSGSKYIIKVGDLAPGAKGEATITGQLLGQQQTISQATVALLLSPANFPNEQLTKSAVAATTITALPLELSVDMATAAAPGDRVLGIIHVRNVGRGPLVNSYLKLAVPPGVDVAKEDTEFSPDFSLNDSTWMLPTLEPLAEVTRTLVAYIQGEPGEHREITVEAGIREGDTAITQRSVAHVVTVTAPQLLITQTYNGKSADQTAIAGQAMTGLVHYKNVGTVGLKDVIVSVKFAGAGIDPGSLKLSQGSYDPLKRTISWSAATVPGLATLLPQQEGDLNYQFTILALDKLPTDDKGKNLRLVSTATIDSPNLPTPVGQERKVVTDQLVVSLTTNLTLGIDAFYDDGRLGITSTGPLPPKVGEQTTYTIRVRAGSSINDAEDVRVSLILPDGVSYTEKKYMTKGTMDFNSRTGEVTWNVPLLAGLTGRSAPAEELDIQVAITPGEDKRGKEVLLVGSLQAQATDGFTNQIVNNEIKTLPTTETAAKEKGKVE